MNTFLYIAFDFKDTLGYDFLSLDIRASWMQNIQQPLITSAASEITTKSSGTLS